MDLPSAFLLFPFFYLYHKKAIYPPNFCFRQAFFYSPTKYMPTYHKLAFRRKGIIMGFIKSSDTKKPERQFPPKHEFRLGTNLAKKLIVHHSILVKFGSSVSTAYLWLTNQKNSDLTMQPTIAKQLLLPTSSTLYARFDNRSIRLRIGPLLGILIDAIPPINLKTSLGLMTKFFEECSQCGKKTRHTSCHSFPSSAKHCKKSRCKLGFFHKNQWIKKRLFHFLMSFITGLHREE